MNPFSQLVGADYIVPSLEDVRSSVYDVCKYAKGESSPGYVRAKSSVDSVVSFPPSAYPHKSLQKYLEAVALKDVPAVYWCSDVFWCCFLVLADETGIPECSYGGPLGKLVYSIYDDFDPRDVEVS